MRVIDGARCQLCPYQSKQFPLECPNKLVVPITDDVSRQPLKSEDLSEE
jgi:hypothetical protein